MPSNLILYLTQFNPLIIKSLLIIYFRQIPYFPIPLVEFHDPGIPLGERRVLGGQGFADVVLVVVPNVGESVELLKDELHLRFQVDEDAVEKSRRLGNIFVVHRVLLHVLNSGSHDEYE